MELFVCPVCKTKNGESQKYCSGCGHWLLSETFSAKKHQADNNTGRLYICAFCDTANEPNRNACKKCLKPLFSTEYETKEIKNKKIASARTATGAKKAGFIFPVIIIALILFGVYKWDNEAKFDKMEVGEQYVLSQFVIKRPFLRAPSAAADFTTLEDSKNPLEVVAVFYAKDGNRLGTASAVLTNGVPKNQTSTINFAFDGSPMLTNLGQVRVEIKQLSPLQLLERAADKVSKLPLK